ncbi:hypothetical protein H0H81_006447 [Sphagnurus paluster]|uniref:Uncharacterized protein n=1 Tax=Sphagnurus paluster TaxID=117069 RepID=A0A9P7FY06_9AGAR|nr:hypothetical protein H0H81_006447 [Sphagnurus paluster]
MFLNLSPEAASGDSREHQTLLTMMTDALAGSHSQSLAPQSEFHVHILHPATEIDDQHQEQGKYCSVRGCAQPLLANATTKMCETCRGRHRIYASTKRARRKLEKASVVGVRRVGDHVEAVTAPPPPPPKSATSSSISTPTWTDVPTTTAWDNTAIDPQLFANSMPIHQPVVFPMTSSSSELAGALTLPSPNPNTTAATDVDPPVIAIEGEGPLRPCSVKGCKMVIPDSASYTFKMCPQCRTRYRTYGNTKRAKWKAEREAFDRELAGLRTKEDERRRIAGERPLSESPDDLRAWELSIIDEEMPLSLSVTSAPSNTGGEMQHTYTGPKEASTGHALTSGESFVFTSTNTLTIVIGIAQLAVRMCTVSHCHKVLPGFYRYKRCEQHRLQNRQHSQLKRVREKGAKSEGETDEGVDEEEDGEADADAEVDPDADPETKTEQDDPTLEEDKKALTTKRSSSCATPECQNLLARNVRWRHCDVCRARERVLRREKRETEDEAQREVERLREIVKAMQEGKPVDLSTVLGGGSSTSTEVTTMTGGGTSEVPQADPTVSTLTAAQSTAPTQAHTPYPHTFQSVFRATPSHTPDTASMPLPSAESPVSNIPTGSTSGSRGTSELTFHVYKPPVAATGTTIVRAGGETARAFREMVRRDQQTSKGMVGPSSYHVYKNTPPPTSNSASTPTPNPTPTQTVGGFTMTHNEHPPPGKQPKTPLPSTGTVTGTPSSASAVGQDAQIPASTSTLPSSTISPSTSGPTTDPTSAAKARKPRASRAKPKPTPPPAVPSPTTASAPGSVPGYAYPHGQYPYPYYLPPYAYGPGYTTSSSAGYPPSSAYASYPPSSSPYPPPSSSAYPPPSSAYPPSSYPPSSSPYPPSSSPYPPSSSYPPPSSSPYPTSSSYPPTSSSSSPYPPGYPPSYSTYSPYPYSYPPPPPGYTYGYSYSSRYPPGTYPPHYGYAPSTHGYGPPSTSASADPSSSVNTSGTSTANGNASTSARFAHYQPPVTEGERKRKRRKIEDPAAAAAASSATNPTLVSVAPSSYTSTMPPQDQPRHQLPPPPQVIAEPYSLHSTNVSHPVVTTPAPTPDVTPASAPTAVPGPSTPSQQICCESNHEANTQAQPEPSTALATPTQTTSSPKPSRTCVNKTCHRTVPTDVMGTFCERCRARVKKHQAKTRQRFKLEPRKSLLMGSSFSASVRKSAGPEEVVTSEGGSSVLRDAEDHGNDMDTREDAGRGEALEASAA